MASLLSKAQQGIRQLFRANQIKLFPLPTTLRDYSSTRLRSDLKAGVNVALLAFPQGMAYAFIAGLPIQFGIYGSIIAAIIGPLFARSHFVTLGPTNATSVMLLSTFAMLGASEAEKLSLLPLLLLMVGFLLIAGAFLRVANLIQYISRTVITGYITAAAFLIISNQIHNILGYGLSEHATTLFQVVRQTIIQIDETQWGALLMGGLTAGVFLAAGRWLKWLPNVAGTLILMSLLGYVLKLFLPIEFETLDAVNPGNWSVSLPAVSFESISALASPALAITLLCVLETMSIGKSLAARAGERLDANQEMFSLGMANVGCGFLSGMPASGSLTRSVLNWTSGATSPLASIINGTLCGLGVLLVGPLISYIPLPSLAVVVVAIGISLINRHAIRVVLKATRSDRIVFLVTFLGGMILPLDTAIYYGVGTSIVLFLRKAAEPEMVEYTFTDSGELIELDNRRVRVSEEISIVHVEGNLFFGAADLFRDQIRRVFEDPQLKVVILKMRNAHLLDASSMLALEELVRFMRSNDRYLLVSEARHNVIRIFKRSGLLDVVGRENVFPDIASNHTLSTAHALRRAKAIIAKSNTKPEGSIAQSEEDQVITDAPKS